MKLGEKETSEALIRDLYLSLRKTVGQWSEITKQTPQARMGYVGQHLVSVVTGFPGGRSGARGYDLVLPNGKHSEIKTCYRVDQLGNCASCNNVVSSLESECSFCGSSHVVRKDDSKWLIGVKTQADFDALLEPARYYLVLFEFQDLADAKNQNILASIWEVDPRSAGFALCLIDYKLNIQAASASAAPFNLWPYSLKFYMMQPTLIYRSVIEPTDVRTLVFPTDRDSVAEEVLPDLSTLTSARTLTVEALLQVGDVLAAKMPENPSKALAAAAVQAARSSAQNSLICDELAKAIYGPLIGPKIGQIPDHFFGEVPSLENIKSAWHSGQF